MDVLTFIAVIFVTLVGGFILLARVILKHDTAKLTQENEMLTAEVKRLRAKTMKKRTNKKEAK